MPDILTVGLPPRYDPRISTPEFKLAVVRKHFIGQPEREFCDLLNISHGGIRFSSPWLNAKVDQKLSLELYHGAAVYMVRAIVTQVDANEKSDIYGAAFLYASGEFDRLIDHIKHGLPASDNLAIPRSGDLKKRHFGRRLHTSDFQVQIKKLDSADPFMPCEVDNINKGGMGFYASHGINSSLPFEISILISETPHPTIISGKVHYMCEKPGGHYFGVEFETITLELASLLDRLEDILQE